MNPSPDATHAAPYNLPVTQQWTWGLSMMQQTVLLTAIRGPDGLPKYGGVKMLIRWYRRCILLSALDFAVLSTPYQAGGGSFTGPSCAPATEGGTTWQEMMDDIVSDYLRMVDAIPHHAQLHLLHAFEILGYKHPDQEIRSWWNLTYQRLVNDMHLHPETEAELDRRLSDTREGWLERADPATVN